MQRRVFVKAPHLDSNIISHLRSVEVVQKYGNNGGRGYVPRPESRWTLG